MSDEETPQKAKRPQQVYSLIVEVGRKEGDGLPPKATGPGKRLCKQVSGW